MISMRSVIMAALMAAVLAGVAIEASAQISQILRRTGLTPEDYQQVTTAANELFVSGDPRPGASVDWVNDETGASGRAEILSVEGGCATVGHTFRSTRQVGGRDAERSFQLRRCRMDDGRWVSM
jgi:hypothetical protein